MRQRKTTTVISCSAMTEATARITEGGRAYGAAEEQFVGDALFAPRITVQTIPPAVTPRRS
jgi:hypothetical protein